MFLNFFLLSSFINHSLDAYLIEVKNTGFSTYNQIIKTKETNNFDKISIVDFRYILKESNAMKKLGSQFLLLENQMNNRMKEEQIILKNKETSIINEKPKISNLEYKNKIDNFKKEVLKTQRKFKEERSILNKSFQNIQNNLKDLLAKVIKELSLKKNVDVVFLKENVFLYNKSSLDITDEVLQVFNDKTKSFKIIINSTD
jgi:Skp family chaperone for outer membrane proteins